MILYFIYETTNLINGKKYRGYHQTENLQDKYIGSGKIIKQAISKYGRENFNFTILEFCSSKEIMIERERFYVDEKWKNDPTTYNLIVGGCGHGKIGTVNSEETRNKISATLKRRYAAKEIKVWNEGIENAHSTETRKKMSDARTGTIMSDETKEKLREVRKLQAPLSSEARKQLSESLKLAWKEGRKSNEGRVCTEETKARMSEASKGRKHSHESIKKMQLVQKGKIISENQREKIRRKLLKPRIEIIKECARCGKEFVLTVIENTKNTSTYQKNFCSSKCSYANNGKK